MPHVAEGELHAWLDGALDQLGEKRADQVREHLRRCATCQQSLAAEGELRARATEVLGLATPRAGDMPPLEALMERAMAAPTPAAATPSRMSAARRRLAWAASIVVALGAGWMARELGLHGPMAADEAAVRVASAPVPAVSARADEPRAEETALGDLAAAPSEAEAPAESGRVANAPAAADAGARVALERVVTDVAQSTAKLEEEVPSNVVATAPPPAFEPAPPARESVGLGATAGAGAAGPAGPPARDATPAPPRVVASEQQRAVAGGVGAASRAGNAPTRPASGRQERAAAVAQSSADGIGIQRARPESARSDVPDLFVEGRARGAANDRQGARAPVVTAEADEDEARGLIVPGLEVIRAHWTEVVPGQTGLRVLQRLPSGDTLEIRFVRSGGAAADAAADPLAAILSWEPLEGWNQVVVPQREGWLVARARLSEPELSDLLDGIGAARR